MLNNITFVRKKFNSEKFSTRFYACFLLVVDPLEVQLNVYKYTYHEKGLQQERKRQRTKAKDI